MIYSNSLKRHKRHISNVINYYIFFGLYLHRAFDPVAMGTEAGSRKWQPWGSSDSSNSS